jgi:hypothetical protein
MEKMPSYTVQMGRNRPTCLGLAQPLRLVAQHDGNRGQRSATTALAAVRDSGQPAPEVGGEQVLWQGGGVVDYFEAKKRSEGGSPKLSTTVLVADEEPMMEARTGGRGGMRLGRGAARCCTGARGRVSWEFRGARMVLHRGSTSAAQRCSGVGGRRREKGSFTGVGLPL